MSHPKKISSLARKVLEVPTSLEINFSTSEVGLPCTVVLTLKRLVYIIA